MKKLYLFFDLDGTLTDPMIGITHSVQYALASFGIEENDLHQLCTFIGPPLKDSFREFYGFSNEQAEIALIKYREYFSKRGIFENQVYDGIPALLAQQKKSGRKLMLATSKPEIFARQILDYFNLSHYFSFIGGATLDGKRSTKTDVIRYVLKSNKIDNPSDVIMIGDRKHDIEGAQANNIQSIGVLYGYGSEKELYEAGANIIVASVTHLQNIPNTVIC